MGTEHRAVLLELACAVAPFGLQAVLENSTGPLQRQLEKLRKDPRGGAPEWLTLWPTFSREVAKQGAQQKWGEVGRKIWDSLGLGGQSKSRFLGSYAALGSHAKLLSRVTDYFMLGTPTTRKAVNDLPPVPPSVDPEDLEVLLDFLFVLTPFGLGFLESQTKGLQRKIQELAVDYRLNGAQWAALCKDLLEEMRGVTPSKEWGGFVDDVLAECGGIPVADPQRDALEIQEALLRLFGTLAPKRPKTTPRFVGGQMPIALVAGLYFFGLDVGHRGMEDKAKKAGFNICYGNLVRVRDCKLVPNDADRETIPQLLAHYKYISLDGDSPVLIEDGAVEVPLEIRNQIYHFMVVFGSWAELSKVVVATGGPPAASATSLRRWAQALDRDNKPEKKPAECRCLKLLTYWLWRTGEHLKRISVPEYLRLFTVE